MLSLQKVPAPSLGLLLLSGLSLQNVAGPRTDLEGIPQSRTRFSLASSLRTGCASSAPEYPAGYSPGVVRDPFAVDDAFRLFVLHTADVLRPNRSRAPVRCLDKDH